ncbi:nucleoside triphosphate pyrophosphohydrolase family protein [uncultured Leptotrichia sp.]|uniref:nucleoside triphosphate pyrophosphohydrolase family protein n=1 Tax=uncultured Leptotrichia sp. TaxID=159271 RepID=UPI002605ED91|nr:nucleoside triphosphate pyrophosphohydrolase family protein [uncultured Leptotrichia sp.]
MEQWNKLVGLVKKFYIAFGQQEFLEKEMTNERMELRKKLFDEEFKEYEMAEKNKDKVEMLDAVCDMYYIYIGTLLELHKGNIGDVRNVIFFEKDEESELIFKKVLKNEFNDIFVEAFEEVHRSNMSKLENGKVIFREDGKIIKGKNYFRPNLKQFIK